LELKYFLSLEYVLDRTKQHNQLVMIDGVIARASLECFAAWMYFD
jgi:hypothetical protein